MHEPLTFETRLADAFERYLTGAPVAIDERAFTAALETLAPTTSPFRSPTLARRRLAIGLLLAILVAAITASALLVLGHPSPQPLLQANLPVFATVGRVGTGYEQPVVVTMLDGRVLISNGESADIFDPATGQTTAVSANRPIGLGRGILLPDGRVLVIHFDTNSTSSYAYIFDPVTSQWHDLPQPGFSNAPPFGVEPSISLLQDGRVLLTGGLADVYRDDVLSGAMIFDPASEKFTRTGAMRDARRWQASVTLADGRVLVAAGEEKNGDVSTDVVGSHLSKRSFLSSAELYDPSLGTFAVTGSLTSVRGEAIAVLLADGRVLVAPRASGWGEEWRNSQLEGPIPDGVATPTELYDPTTGIFSLGPSIPGAAATATVLSDGRVLLTGERVRAGAPRSMEGWIPWSAIFDPSTQSVVDGPVPPARIAQASLLLDGRILFAGGLAGEDPVNGGGVAALTLETFSWRP